MHVSPPAVILGNKQHARAALHDRMQMTLLASAREKWLAFGLSPICLGDASAAVLTADLQAGSRMQCLVWSAAGVGWEHGASDATFSLRSLCASLEQYPPPPLLVVCMQFGARLAAKQLIKAGVPAVLWVQGCFASEALTCSLLLGVIAPLLETLRQASTHTHKLSLLRFSCDAPAMPLTDRDLPSCSLAWTALRAATSPTPSPPPLDQSLGPS